MAWEHVPDLRKTHRIARLWEWSDQLRVAHSAQKLVSSFHTEPSLMSGSVGLCDIMDAVEGSRQSDCGAGSSCSLSSALSPP